MLNLTRRSFWGALVAPIAAAAALIRRTPAPPATQNPDPREWQWIPARVLEDLLGPGRRIELGLSFRVRGRAKWDPVAVRIREPFTVHTIIARERREHFGAYVSARGAVERAWDVEPRYAIVPALPGSLNWCVHCSRVVLLFELSRLGLCRECSLAMNPPYVGLKIDRTFIEECQNIDNLPAGWEKSLEQALGYDPIRRNA